MIDPSGSKYDRMHERSVESIRKKIRGKSILDHGLWFARSHTFVDGAAFQTLTWMRVIGGALYTGAVKLMH